MACPAFPEMRRVKQAVNNGCESRWAFVGDKRGHLCGRWGQARDVKRSTAKQALAIGGIGRDKFLLFEPMKNKRVQWLRWPVPVGDTGNTLSPDRMVFWTRSVNVAIGLLLGLLLFMWSRRLYGLKAAYLTLFLFAFCPNLIAHGSVVTTDLGGVAFALLFLYLLVLTIKGTQGHVILPWCCGAALGAALLSKFTNVIFLPLFATSYIFLAGETLSLVRACTPKSIRTVVIILATSWVTVCGVYQFDRVFIPHTLDDADAPRRRSAAEARC